MEQQPQLAELHTPIVKIAGAVLVAVGMLFVVSSMWVLGITGTYLGDYCGILMPERITSFPFSVMENPMYWGSTMGFIGAALWCASADA